MRANAERLAHAPPSARGYRKPLVRRDQWGGVEHRRCSSGVGMTLVPRKSSPQRLQDSSAIRRRRSLLGLLLMLVGAAALTFGIVTARTEAPAPVEIDADGTTAVPPTHFYQQPWVLYAEVDDPRRVPDLDEIGCRTEGDLSLPAQPADLTEYGSRVVDGESIAAVALLSRSGPDAAITCADAGSFGPLWLRPSSDAPPFTPIAIALLGVLVLVAGLLVHPTVAEIPTRLRDRRSNG
jgi:hypothetical protein